MCLLVVFHRVSERWPLVIGANRDERLDRPASPMGVLQPSGPRIVGGRDQRAGGTWLAINEHGVVAGLTNKPAFTTPLDPGRRSRGELPIMLAKFESAASAAEGFDIDAADYNACWMFVADRDSLHYIDVTGSGRPRTEQLEPGVHVLENAPLGADTGKQQQVRAAVEGFATWPGQLVQNLAAVMSSHRDPQACVHLGGYGTRSSTIVLADRSPRVFNTDQRPCEHPHDERAELWEPSTKTA